VLRVGDDPRALREHFLNLELRHAVLLAFSPVALIPIEAIDLDLDRNMRIYICIYSGVSASIGGRSDVVRCARTEEPFAKENYT
jgi:hypothetical protein